MQIVITACTAVQMATAELRYEHAQFPDRRMLDHRIFQQLNHQLREILPNHVTRHDAGRRRAVRCPSLKESI
ncbi:hypothetical protein TNCV_2462281 [Trichonephila clavipes]|nr:hypothetical protein TNCV_2462281 [Trichonephila clavipes]